LPKTIQVDNCIITAIDEVNGAIVSDVYAICDDAVIEHIQNVANTQDNQFMDALHKLGWASPGYAQTEEFHRAMIENGWTPPQTEEEILSELFAGTITEDDIAALNIRIAKSDPVLDKLFAAIKGMSQEYREYLVDFLENELQWKKADD
jgi:hypothetical protein